MPLQVRDCCLRFYIRSMIQLDLIFAYGVRYGPREDLGFGDFVCWGFLHADIQLFGHTC